MLDSNFTHLKNLRLADYNFVYELNENCYRSDIKNIEKKELLRFNGLENTTQQLNLMMIEYSLPNILSNIVLCIIQERNTSLNTILLKQSFENLVLKKDGDYYIKHQLKKFLHHLLFSNIGSSNVFDSKMEFESIYYCKSQNVILQYFSAFQLNDLLGLVFTKSFFQIDLKKSFIKNGYGTINLSIKIK